MNLVHSFLITIIFFCSVAAQTIHIATIHPLQQIVSELIDDHSVVHDLLPAGASPHTYEPTPADLKCIESAAILFYVGANLDDWIKKFPARSTIEVINLIPRDSLIYFENFQAVNHEILLEGKPVPIHAHHKGIDPHFWTDPLLVKILASNLADTLSKLFPERKPAFWENYRRFSKQLEELDMKIRERLKPLAGESILQAHPFFNYYLHRYGLKSGGVIEINPGVDPTARQIKSLIDLIRQENITAIFTQPQLPDRAAYLIAESTGIPVIQLDPLGGKSPELSYAGMLLANTERIIGALR